MTFQEYRRRILIDRFVRAVLYLTAGFAIALLCASGIAGIFLAGVLGWAVLKFGPR